MTMRGTHRGSFIDYFASSRSAFRNFFAACAASAKPASTSGSYGVSRIPRSVSTASSSDRQAARDDGELVSPHLPVAPDRRLGRGQDVVPPH